MNSNGVDTLMDDDFGLNKVEKIHFRSILLNYDIICLTETGKDPIGDVPGFKLIQMIRDDNSRHAGVVILINNEIANACTTKRMHHSLGILWLEIALKGHAKVFLAGCYFPHQYSSRHLNSKLKVIDHFNCLNSDIEEFSALGKIIICGDMNSRTGSSEDRPSINVESLRHVGLIEDTNSKIAPRLSCDTKTNSMGKLLLNVCKDNNIVILNGRLKGDCHPINGGNTTFAARGREGKSLIDYFIATPHLVFDDEGVPVRGNSLRVSSPQCIKALTDHSLVALRVNIPKEEKQKQHKEESTVRFKFRPEIMESFTDILRSDEMASRLECVGNDELSAVESYVRFNDIIVESLRKVDSLHKNVVAKEPKINAYSNAPVNSWYNEDCRTLRNEWKEIQGRSGTLSHAANTARARYRTLTRRLSRQHKEMMAKNLIDKLKSNPRLFWKQYKGNSSKCPLMNVEEWAKFFANTFQPSEYNEGESIAASLSDIEAARSLNNPITETEVYAELLKLKRNKAVGVDGIPAEFYIPIKPDQKGKFPFSPPTQNILVPIIARLFNRILNDDYPTQCADSAITPIPKSKGSLTEYDNYRGIAVGSVLPKILSMILNTRGNKWAESNNKRAVGQFGFRPGRSTLDATFILRHTLEVYQARKKSVYCAFIDFRKAYDSVNRQILWCCLEQMGIHGNYMNTIKNMYREVRMRVRVGNRMSEAFLAEAGVKQGDNLSPLLFGLFIDQVEKFFMDRCGENEGIRIADNLCRVILYADDLAILSESVVGLQNMLHHLEEFCDKYKMEVNTAKSAVVIFNNDNKGKVNDKWYFKDKILPIKKEFIYLGVVFVGNHGRNGGTHEAGEKQLATANRATHALWKRCSEIGLTNANTLSYLYGTLIQPILNYGCEVWATDRLSNINTSYGLVGKCETIHTKFLKRALGVRVSTSNNLVLNELNRSPSWTQWLKQCVGFWNKIVIRKNDDFVKKALVENVKMAVIDKNKHCWSHGFLRCIQRIGAIEHISDVLIDNNSLLKIDLGMIDDSIAQITDIKWQELESLNPRALSDDQGRGIKSITYAKWMRSLEVNNYNTTFTKLLNNHDDIRCIARLRLRAHNLNVDLERDLPRSSRSCRCCDMIIDSRRAVEDELHFMIECPLYNNERKELFTKLRVEPECMDKDLQMRIIMNPTSFEGWKYLIKFIKKCDAKRNDIISNVAQTWIPVA